MKVKVGVIGLGTMGSAHARVYSKIKECDLVGVCDLNPEKKYLAQKYRCQFFTDSEELLRQELDAVSICTPTSTHKEIALEALEEDKHILVEKPLSLNVASGEEIVKKAIITNKLLAVGFTERFNPAINKLKKVVDFSQIYSTVSIRFGPNLRPRGGGGEPRIKDMGVLLDLGSHEIDLLTYLTKAQPKILYAYVSYHYNNDFEDYAYVSLKCNEVHSHIETSWIPNYKLRQLILYGNEGFYTLNYAQQTLKSNRAPPRVKMEIGNWKDMMWISRNVDEDIPVQREEPLKLELQCFIKSIKKGDILDPICRGKEAVKVLKIVEKALMSCEYHHLKA